MRPLHYETFSTTGLPVRQRLSRWIEFGSHALSEMRVDPVDGATFEASLSRVVVADLGVCWMTTTPAIAQSADERIGDWAASTPDSVLLILQDSGRSWMDHNGWTGELHPGDVVFRNSTSPWRTRALEPSAMVFIRFPALRLLAAIEEFDMGGAPIRYAPGRAGLAASVVRSVQRALAQDTGDVWPNDVTDLILESLKLSCRSDKGKFAATPTVLGSGQRLRQEVYLFVEKHFADSGLSAGVIANQFRVTPRFLQRLFAEVGQTPSRYILDRRLERAAKMLRRSDEDGSVSITEIAYSVGFNELSYFCRSFSRRFHTTPREYHKAWREGALDPQSDAEHCRSL